MTRFPVLQRLFLFYDVFSCFTTYFPVLQITSLTLLFVPNLKGCISQGIIFFFQFLDATDLCQPVDAGYGRLLKQKIRQRTEAWLEDDDNMDLWLGNSDETLGVSRRRVLITKFVGEAFEELEHENYDGFRMNCFDRTGCNLTADGSEDFKVKPEGLPDYKPIPPQNEPGPNYEPEIFTPEAADPPEDIFQPDFDDDSDEDLDEEPELENEEADDPNDRLYDLPMVGKKIRGLYKGSGWCTGTVMYYNTKIDKYLLVLEDKSKDYFEEQDINGVDMCYADQEPRRAKRVDYSALAKGNL